MITSAMALASFLSLASVQCSDLGARIDTTAEAVEDDRAREQTPADAEPVAGPSAPLLESMDEGTVFAT